MGYGSILQNDIEREGVGKENGEHDRDGQLLFLVFHLCLITAPFRKTITSVLLSMCFSGLRSAELDKTGYNKRSGMGEGRIQ